MLGLGAIFTLFFVTLGPLKVLGPFAQQTQALEPAALRSLSLRVFVIALIAVLAGGYLGEVLASNWHISVPAITIATGIIFLLVAISAVMTAYEAPHAPPALLPAAPIAAALRLTFPTVVTPYGIAALIALLAVSDNSTDSWHIYALLVFVMVLNLLAMLFVRQVMRGIMLLILQILGAVLGVLQVCLAIQIIIIGLRALNVLPR